MLLFSYPLVFCLLHCLFDNAMRSHGQQQAFSARTNSRRSFADHVIIVAFAGQVDADHSDEKYNTASCLQSAYCGCEEECCFLGQGGELLQRVLR